jgi:L-alanine-DL-glutamate epimerase-like enolase superfamily enzyme
VRITTDQGIQGVGEGFPWPDPERAQLVHGYIKSLGETLVGYSPPAITGFVQRARAMGKRLDQNFTSAISAIEIALWDILGQMANVPEALETARPVAFSVFSS